MLYAYLFATIIGGVMLTASLLGAGHHGLDHDVDGLGGHDADGDGVPDGDTGGAITFALRIVSVRALTYCLAFGGATGLLLRVVAHTQEPVTFGLAMFVGVVAGAIAQSLFRRVARSGAGSTVSLRDLVGRTADVVVPFAKGQTGKVRVHVKGADVDVLATTEDAQPIDARDEVLVVEMRDGNALVTRSPTQR